MLEIRTLGWLAKSIVKRYGGINRVFVGGAISDQQNVLQYIVQESNREQRRVAGLK